MEEKRLGTGLILSLFKILCTFTEKLNEIAECSTRACEVQLAQVVRDSGVDGQ